MVVPVRQQGANVSTKIFNRKIYPTEWKALRRNDLNARTERFIKSENNLPIKEFLKLARSKLEQSRDTPHSSDGSSSSSNREAFDTKNLEETLRPNEIPIANDEQDSSAGNSSNSKRKAFDTKNLEEVLPQNETPVTSSSSRLTSISTIGSVHMSSVISPSRSNGEDIDTENLEETLQPNEQPDDTQDSSAGSPSSRNAFDIDDLKEALAPNEIPAVNDDPILSSSRLSSISSIGSAHLSSESDTVITESTSISDNLTESSYDTLTNDSVSIQREDYGFLREIHVGIGPNTTCADLEAVRNELGYLVTNEICRIRESGGHKPAMYIISFHDL